MLLKSFLLLLGLEARLSLRVRNQRRGVRSEVSARRRAVARRCAPWREPKFSLVNLYPYRWGGGVIIVVLSSIIKYDQ